MNIIIIGSGWYGLHTLKYLSKKYTNYNIILLEKNNEIFENSSNYNQNRLHLGYHYPRSNKTRNLCKEGYHKFIKEYRDVIDFIDKNYYLIANESNIDYETFIKIYSNDIDYDHTIIKNEYFKNIDGNIINTKEKIINSEKAKQYFIKNININKIKFNYKVEKLEQKNNKIIINDELECDLLIDCSYNQMNLSRKKYIYELTISLLYNKINNTNFESLTIMDGNFFSLFPRNINKDKYTLTHVKYTPLIKSENINDILTYKVTDDILENVKNNMEKDVKIYYAEFKNNFQYVDYFTSYKCKLISNNDTRECNIEEYNNIITVNCGKITGIFELDEYLDNYLYKKI